MPGYEWVNHSWLYDLVLNVLYTKTGFISLSVAGALIGLITFHLCIYRVRLAFWQIAVLAMFFAALTKDILIQGIRTQVVGLLLLAILGDFLLRQRDGRNWPQLALPGVAPALLPLGEAARLLLARPRRRRRLPRLGAISTSLRAASLAAGFISLHVGQANRPDHAHSSVVTYCIYGPSCSEGMAEYLLKNPPVGRVSISTTGAAS